MHSYERLLVNYGDVLYMGRITRLDRPSVRPSVRLSARLSQTDISLLRRSRETRIYADCVKFNRKFAGPTSEPRSAKIPQNRKLLKSLLCNPQCF